MPAPGLRLWPEAEVDLHESYVWYEQRSVGLGESFLAELDRLLALILERPYIYQEIYRGLRRATTHRFPFAVFYMTSVNGIDVLAILHQMRSPERWRTRISG